MKKRYFFLILLSCTINLTAQNDLQSAITTADSLSNIEQYEEAIIILAAALEDIDVELISDTLEGIARRKLGINQYLIDEDQAAISSWQSSLEIWELSLFNAKTHDDSLFALKYMVKEYRNIGNAYVELGKYEEAIAAHQLALTHHNLGIYQSTSNLLDIYEGLGNAYTGKNDVSNAEIYLQSALGINQRLAFANPYEYWRVVQAYNLFVLLYQQMRDSDQMIIYAQKALQASAKIPTKDDYDIKALADLYNNLGIAYEWKEDYTTAIKYYQKSLELNNKYAHSRYNSIIENDNNIALAFHLDGSQNKAIGHIDKAIQLATLRNDSLLLAAAYNTQGTILKVSNKIKALKSYQQSIQYLIADVDLSKVESIPTLTECYKADKIQLIRSLADKATLLHELGLTRNDEKYLLQSLDTYTLIHELIDQVRLNFKDDTSKAFLSSRAKKISEQALSLCIDLYEKKTGTNKQFLAKALEYSERSKALILLEAVGKAIESQEAKTNIERLAEENACKRERVEIRRRINNSNDGATRTVLYEELVHLNSICDTIGKSVASPSELLQASNLIDLSTIQSQLDTNECILEYFVGEQQIYWFHLSEEQFTYDIIPLDFPLEQWVQDFRSSIYNYENDDYNKGKLVEIYTDLGYRLYEKLLQPVEQKVGLKNKLKIVTDGILGYIPFDALLTEKVAEKKSKVNLTYPFLHEKNYCISYTYSIALLEEMKQLQHNANQNMLAFAPSFTAMDTLMLGKMPVMFAEVFKNSEAVDKILKLFKGKDFKGSIATKEQFLALAEQYRFIHLATHAQMNEENSEYSFITFTQKDEHDIEQLLFVSELYLLQLQAEMVVLSACETGIGELSKGEGIISLARAFSYAGAKSIITSLWKVKDDKTSELTKEFYKQLETGKSKDEALQLAKHHLIQNDYAHPYYWSGFIPIGDMSSVSDLNKSNVNWYYYLVGGIVSILLLLFLLRRRKKANLQQVNN